MHISLIFSILSYTHRDVNAEKGEVQSERMEDAVQTVMSQ